MDVEHVQTSNDKLPEVGQCWSHPDTDEVFLRISDREGRKALEHANDRSDRMYGVCLQSGRVKHTTLGADELEIVKARVVVEE